MDKFLFSIWAYIGREVGMKVHKSSDHFRTVDCNEKLPHVNSLEKRTLRNAHISTLRH